MKNDENQTSQREESPTAHCSPFLDLRCMDNMQLMTQYPDDYFDIAIVDPPYGISAPNMQMGSRKGCLSSAAKSKKGRLHGGQGKLKDRSLNTMGSQWDKTPPTEAYFKELFRVSQNQIIWGGNYFDLPPTRGIICWDKKQSWDNFSAWEMAWSSFDRVAKIFRYCNSGSHLGKKIHPTQKPIALYKWLLDNYAEKGMSILDTHMGSGSIAIACYYAGVDLTACELDRNYYEKACSRVERETRQTAFI